MTNPTDTLVIDCGYRHSGKTFRMIERAAQKWLYIVCVDKREVGRVAQKAQQMGKDIPFPITFDEFMRGEFHPSGINGFLIDNVDVALARCARGVPIMAMTATQERRADLVHAHMSEDPT